MSRLAKAKAGQRITEALEAIKRFEATQQDWGFPELADAIGVSPSQARGLVATLTLKGFLQPREVTVRKTLPALTDVVEQQSAA